MNNYTIISDSFGIQILYEVGHAGKKKETKQYSYSIHSRLIFFLVSVSLEDKNKKIITKKK